MPPPILATSALAITAVTLGIAALIVPVAGIALGLAGVILGIMAIRRITRRPGRLAGKGWAVAGIATGAVAVVVWTTALAIDPCFYCSEPESNPTLEVTSASASSDPCPGAPTGTHCLTLRVHLDNPNGEGDFLNNASLWSVVAENGWVYRASSADGPVALAEGHQLNLTLAFDLGPEATAKTLRYNESDFFGHKRRFEAAVPEYA